MDTDSFTVYIKTGDIYVDIAKDVEARFDTSNYELDRPLPKENKKIVVLMKDEPGEKILEKFAAFRAKTYSYLTDKDDGDTKAKGTKKCVIKKKLKLKDQKNCLKAIQLENEVNQLGKNIVDTEDLRENHNEFMKNEKNNIKNTAKI